MLYIGAKISLLSFMSLFQEMTNQISDWTDYMREVH
uniref:Uncharacterized protein n=1 Tax=Anguilla anguilla TaxID=7936 RepID=A0A0E9S5Y9_ANGAN